MADIVIKDLDMSEELDKKAMEKVVGGYWFSSHTSMGWWSSPWGGGGYSNSSTSWGGGWWDPWGMGGPGMGGPGWGGPAM
ncbi:MAG: hypothetical protein SWQ30_09515 [Thermodesulfobacteriota bacterium]|nr:hypothetical protein [Thermodesulfobacteriota bacterium]